MVPGTQEGLNQTAVVSTVAGLTDTGRDNHSSGFVPVKAAGGAMGDQSGDERIVRKVEELSWVLKAVKPSQPEMKDRVL